jgi:hypothetical protein
MEISEKYDNTIERRTNNKKAYWLCSYSLRWRVCGDRGAADVIILALVSAKNCQTTFLEGLVKVLVKVFERRPKQGIA